MQSQQNSVIKCPQCGNLCLKTTSPLTNEHSIECRVCGYQEIKTIKNTDIFKGYGALIVNDTAILFHEPILFENEQAILNSISENPNAQFIKWTDEHGVTVLKGELPQECIDEDEESLKLLISEEQYYKDINGQISATQECVPFECVDYISYSNS